MLSRIFAHVYTLHDYLQLSLAPQRWKDIVESAGAEELERYLVASDQRAEQWASSEQNQSDSDVACTQTPFKEVISQAQGEILRRSRLRRERWCNNQLTAGYRRADDRTERCGLGLSAMRDPLQNWALNTQVTHISESMVFNILHKK